MPIKIYLNDQIHRATQLPTNLDAFSAFLSSLFREKLPIIWNFDYIDQENDRITVSHEHDYQELLQYESQRPDITIKLYINPSEVGISQYRPSDEERIANSYPKVEENKFTESSFISGPTEGKTWKTKEFRQAKRLYKKLAKGKLSGAEKEEAAQKFEALQADFTPEQREIFETKKQRYEMKRGIKKQIFAELGEGSPAQPNTETGKADLNCEKDEKTKSAGLEEKRKDEKWCTPLKRAMVQIKQQSPEKAKNIFKSGKMFGKLSKGKWYNRTCLQAELLGILPEENRGTIQEMFNSIPKDLPKEELIEKYLEISKVYYGIYCPEISNVLEDIEQFWREKKESMKEKKEKKSWWKWY